MPFYAWFRAKSRLGQVEKMTITGIEEMNHKKVRVYIDNEFAFVLYKGELRSYQIKEGSEIKEAEYLEITEKLLPKRAKLRCMNLLKAKSYTEKQLRDKLVQGEYRKEAIEEAIGYVKSYGYVDDRKYAEDFITYHMERKWSWICTGKGLIGKSYRKYGKGCRKKERSRMSFPLPGNCSGKKILTRKWREIKKNRRCPHFYIEKDLISG